MKLKRKKDKKMTQTSFNIPTTHIPTVVNKVKTVDLGLVGKIIVPTNVVNKFDCLHKEWPGKEWGGLLFYVKDENSNIKDLKNLTFIVKDFYPMGLGDAGSNSFDYTDITKGIKAVNGLDYNIGLIHSHHNMAAFFSGTDTNDLEVNHVNYDYYVSLVVNIAKSYVCKIAIAGTQKVVMQWKSNGELIEKEETIPVMFVGNLNVELQEGTVDSWFLQRVNDLKESIKKASGARAAYYQQWDNEDYTSWYGNSYTPKAHNNNPINTPTTYNSFNTAKTDEYSKFEKSNYTEMLLIFLSDKETKVKELLKNIKEDKNMVNVWKVINSLAKGWKVSLVDKAFVKSVKHDFEHYDCLTNNHFKEALKELIDYFCIGEGIKNIEPLAIKPLRSLLEKAYEVANNKEFLEN